jgi:hypothetical protein
VNSSAQSRTFRIDELFIGSMAHEHIPMKTRTFILLLTNLLAAGIASADQAGRKHAENDLHARPAVQVTVGVHDADIVGRDNRALQAAVDYVGNLGGGVVLIGPGEYLMRDSLHLRSRVSVRGAGPDNPQKTARSAPLPPMPISASAITIRIPPALVTRRLRQNPIAISSASAPPS